MAPEQSQSWQSFINLLQFCHQKYAGYFKPVLLMLVVLTLFETAQQYFYIERFDLAPQRTGLFIDLMTGHLYRWLLWLVILVIFIVLFAKRLEQTSERFSPLNGRTVFTITTLILSNIVGIAVVEMLRGPNPVSLSAFNEMLVFYFFQKTPIYTLSFIALLVIYHLLNLKDNLLLELVDLKDLNDRQQNAIDELKNQSDFKPLQMLSIKVGNNYKMLAIEDICWLEAYDYCVKIHTKDDQVFAMRKSLKALEKELGSKQFLRIHRKAIVNMQKATEVSFTPTPKVVLDNDLAIEIAQSRIKDVKAFLN